MKKISNGVLLIVLLQIQISKLVLCKSLFFKEPILSSANKAKANQIKASAAVEEWEGGEAVDYDEVELFSPTKFPINSNGHEDPIFEVEFGHFPEPVPLPTAEVLAKVSWQSNINWNITDFNWVQQAWSRAKNKNSTTPRALRTTSSSSTTEEPIIFFSSSSSETTTSKNDIEFEFENSPSTFSSSTIFLKTTLKVEEERKKPTKITKSTTVNPHSESEWIDVDIEIINQVEEKNSTSSSCEFSYKKCHEDRVTWKPPIIGSDKEKFASN